jgi:very-short-patch-repair endonuclease
VPIKKILAGQKTSPEKLHRARQMRRQMTHAETALWDELRRNSLGVHFRRQQIISGFIVDFYCHAAALVIEVDGEVHASPSQKADDTSRDQVLKDLGLRVARFKNVDVAARLPWVLSRIKSLLAG